jgi:flagellar motor switch protein FliG
MSEQQISSETHAEQISALLERFNALPSELAQQQWLEMANGLFQSVLEPAVNSVRTTLTDSLFPSGMAEILKQEPPITMAVVLSKLSLQQACDVLRLIETEVRLDTVNQMGEIRKEQIKRLLEDQGKVGQTVDKQFIDAMGRIYTIGGAEAVAEILQLIPMSDERMVMDNLMSESPKVAEEIGDLMFTFDDLSGINQQDMEQVVRAIAGELSLDVLAKALKLADPAVTAKIRGAMGMTVQRELDEVIELTPPMRVKDVEDEQRKILKVVKEIVYSGQIGIHASGAEELV